MADSKEKSTFEILNAVDVSDHKEDKPTGNGKSLSYLSWAWAWAEVKKRCPDANYEIVKYDGIPYVYDPNTGYMVYTKVTIGGITHEMWLPVMDSNNCAMKAEPYEIQTKYKAITIKPATMFDINKTIMRCLTKNLAMFGLGLYIYAGEDLPEDTSDTSQDAQNGSKSSKKPKDVKQPIQNMPSDSCTICGCSVADYEYTDNTGKTTIYKKADILKRSAQLYGAPVCLPCMMKKQAKAKQNKKEE